MSGRVGDLSVEQEEKLRKFRIAVEDVLCPEHDDYFLLKWLRARKFNLKAAESMLRRSLQWRKNTQPDFLVDEYDFPEVIRTYVPEKVICNDKEGCPVWFVHASGLDLKGILYSSKASDVDKYSVLIVENIHRAIKKQSKKLGRPIELFTAIFDLENFTLDQLASKAVIETIINFFRTYQDNYPESLKKVYIINAPKFFPYIYALLAKPVLAQEILKKIRVFPKGDEWKKALLQDIDASELPSYWGGTKVDQNGDTKCPSIFKLGGIVPSSYYLVNRLMKNPNSKTISLGRNSLFPVEVTVIKPRSVIHWEFMIEHYDIGFGIFRRHEVDENENNSYQTCDVFQDIPVVPVERKGCYLIPQDGTVTCDVPGIYVVLFDNSFSWYHTKKIVYNIEVLLPSEQ